MPMVKADVEISLTQSIPPLLEAGGSFGYARAVDGTVWGWGDNARGQLGNGTTKRIPTPSTCALGIEGKEIVQIACGNVATLFLMRNGTVYACGSNNYGQLAQTKNVSILTRPEQITSLQNIVRVACGFGQCLALDASGNVFSWGRNSNGQLGLGDRTNRYVPEKLGLSQIVSIACGGKYCMAMDENHVLYGWGENSYGQLGITGKSHNLLTPTILSMSGSFVEVACGGDTAFGITEEGQLYAWGRNDYYQLGNKAAGKQTSSPVAVELPEDILISSIHAYNSHTSVITGDGALWTWGSVYHGQVGNGAIKSRMLPTACPEADVMLACVGSLQSCYMDILGNVYGAGCNEYGQTGAFKHRRDYYVRTWKYTGLNLYSGVCIDPGND